MLAACAADFSETADSAVGERLRPRQLRDQFLRWPMSLRKQLIVITRPRRSSTEIGAPSTARRAWATADR